MGEALMQQGASIEPVQHWTQALARVAQSGIGGYEGYRAGEAEKAGRGGFQQRLIKAMEGGLDPTESMTLASDEWAPEGAGAALFKSALDPDQEKWAVNPKTGQYYNVNTGEVKPQAPGTAAQIDATDLMKFVNGLETAPGVKGWRQIAPTLASMRKSLSDKSSISDLDFINGVAKILDPTSVVRESEGKMVIESQSITSQTLGTLNKILNGEQALDDKTRRQMYQLARRRGAEHYEQAKRDYDYYTQLGRPYGLNPNQFQPLDPLSEDVQAIPPDPNVPGDF